MSRIATAVIAVVLLVAPQARAAQDLPSLDPVLDVAPPAATGATSMAEDAAALAAELRKGAPLASQLARIGSMAGYEASVEPQVPVSFDDALRALYAAVGVDQEITSRPPAHVAAAVAPLIAATAEAVVMTNAALADVTPAERRWMTSNLGLLGPERTKASERVAEIASRIDVEAMQQASATILAAIDGLPSEIPGEQVAWIDPTWLIEIGGSGADTYNDDRLLLVDLGGNDTHLNSAGGIGPNIYNSRGVPVSVTADLGGNDSYRYTNANQPENGLVAQGVGLGGVGILVDRWGDDYYYASASGVYPAGCHLDPVHFWNTAWRFPQSVQAQGVGGAGVGLVADLSGNDVMYAQSRVATPNNCHFVRDHVHGQGAGLQRGVGVLIDDTGDDYRYLTATAVGFTGFPGAQDFVAGTYGQGFAAGGIGLLADKEGNDYNIGLSEARPSVTTATKGAFATTFVQGAVAGLLLTHGGANRLPQISQVQSQPCLRGATGGQGTACQFAGVGVHVDVMGDDQFLSHADSVHSGPCTVGNVAIAAGQGAAGWSGVGVLANLDLTGTDRFLLKPTASGQCPGYTYQGITETTRAMSYGQGFGGAVRYPIWDNPHSTNSGSAIDNVQGLRPTVPPVGLLVSAGPPCLIPEPGSIAVDLSALDVQAACGTGIFDTAFVSRSHDVYESTPTATNTLARAETESRVQGSGGRPSFNALNVALPQSIGIGALVDVGGHDTHVSAPRTVGSPLGTARSVAQGATEGGIGVLVNVAGDEWYESRPVAPVASGQTNVAQGTTVASFGEPIGPIAVFLEIGGRDPYQAPSVCVFNGTGLNGGAARWGTWGGCSPALPALAFGLDVWSDIRMF